MLFSAAPSDRTKRHLRSEQTQYLEKMSRMVLSGLLSYHCSPLQYFLQELFVWLLLIYGLFIFCLSCSFLLCSLQRPEHIRICLKICCLYLCLYELGEKKKEILLVQSIKLAFKYKWINKNNNSRKMEKSWTDHCKVLRLTLLIGHRIHYIYIISFQIPP